MATLVAKPLTVPAAKAARRALSICHFTTAHSQIKSRSFHRQFLPLASDGISVRYLSPAVTPDARGGVNFLTLPQPVGRVRRALLLPSLLKALLYQHADVYHFQDPELFPAAFILKVFFRKRIIYDAYEDFASAVANKESIPRFFRPLAARAFAAVENAAARCFDGVITADPLTLRRFAQKGKSRKLVFYNFPNLDFFPANVSGPKPFDLVYRGGISERTGIEVLLQALRLLVEPSFVPPRPSPVRLLLIGYFDCSRAEREFHEHVCSLGLDSRVEIRGRIAHEEMARALSQAHIGICPLLAIPKFLRNIPVKVFEYWACAMPVIATDLAPIRPFLRDGRTGLLVPPGDAAALARAIGRLLDHPEEASRMGQQGRELVVRRLNNADEARKLRRFCSQVAGFDD